MAELKARMNDQIKGERLQYGATWTHIKELAVDDEWLVVGSFNWLSNARGSREESSIRLVDPALARKVREEAQASLNRLR